MRRWIKAHTGFARWLIAGFTRLPTVVKGVVTTIEFGLAVGCIWAAWTAGGDMYLVIPALVAGLFFAVIGAGSVMLRIRSDALRAALSRPKQ
jgi:hypothetical protein